MTPRPQVNDRVRYTAGRSRATVRTESGVIVEVRDYGPMNGVWAIIRCDGGGMDSCELDRCTLETPAHVANDVQWDAFLANDADTARATHAEPAAESADFANRSDAA